MLKREMGRLGGQAPPGAFIGAGQQDWLGAQHSVGDNPYQTYTISSAAPTANVYSGSNLMAAFRQNK